MNKQDLYPESFPTNRFLARSRISLYKKRVEKTIAVINDAVEKKLSWYVACSGGKDSVVLAHMVNNIMPGIKIWSEKDEFDFPGERDYMTDLARRYSWDIDIVSPKVSMEEKARRLGVCEDLHSHGTEFSDEFFYALIAQQERLYGGVFLGLRCDESQRRRRNFMKRGYIYKRKNGKHTCIPLAAWSADDVFAYLVSNEIPILEVYFKTLHFDGDPCKIRKSWYLPSARAASGQCAWLKYYYPDLYYKLLEIDPGVSNYV